MRWRYAAARAMTDMQSMLDTKALEVAAQVSANQRAHQEECRDRYLAIDNRLTKIDDKLDSQDDRLDKAMERINALLWKIMIGVITVLLIAAGWMAVQLFTHLADASGKFKPVSDVEGALTPGGYCPAVPKPTSNRTASSMFPTASSVFGPYTPSASPSPNPRPICRALRFG